MCVHIVGQEADAGPRSRVDSKRSSLASRDQSTPLESITACKAAQILLDLLNKYVKIIMDMMYQINIDIESAGTILV